MRILIAPEVIRKIHSCAEEAYPDEGAGFLLGTDGEARTVREILPAPNSRESGERRNRYLLGPDDYMKAEVQAQRLHLDLVGVFHSHPDHPNQPSDFDREWAQPSFSYVITSVSAGAAVASRSWRLADDRSHFTEEEIQISK